MNLEKLIQEIKSQFRQGKKLDSIMPLVNSYTSLDWKNHLKFSKEHYTKKLVYGQNLFAIYVIGWNNNQKSSVHDHAQNGCLMKILKGSLIQQTYSKNIKPTEKIWMKQGKVYYIDNEIGFHKIINTSGKTVSLHIYSPNNYQATVYNEN